MSFDTDRFKGVHGIKPQTSNRRVKIEFYSLDLPNAWL